MPSWSDLVPEWAAEPERKSLAAHLLDNVRNTFQDATQPLVQQGVAPLIQQTARAAFDQATMAPARDAVGAATRALFDQMTQPMMDAVVPQATAPTSDPSRDRILNTPGIPGIETTDPSAAPAQLEAGLAQARSDLASPTPGGAALRTGATGITDFVRNVGESAGRIIEDPARVGRALNPGQLGASIMGQAANGPGAVLGAAGEALQTAGDVANLYPTPAAQIGNAAFAVTRRGAMEAGLPEPVADVAGMVGAAGIPGIATQIGRSTGLLDDAGRAAGEVAGRLATEESGALKLPFGTTRTPNPATAPIDPNVLETPDQALDRMLDMFSGGKLPPPPTTEVERAVQSVSTRIGEAAFDRLYPLKRVQDLVYDRLGRSPTPAEDVYLQARLFAGRAEAAAVDVKQNLLPAIRRVQEADLPFLNSWLAAADNADKAAAVGQRAEVERLGRELPPVAGTTDLRRANASLEGRRRAGATPARMAAADLRVKRLEGVVEDNTAVAETARLDQAATTGAEVAGKRLFSGAVHAQDLDATRQSIVSRLGPDRAQAVFDAADGVWDYTSGLRSRLRDAGLISDDLFQQWETNFPHYSRADILKYLPDNAGAGVGNGQSIATIADAGIRALTETGTTSARDLPVNSVIRQAFAVESQVRRNQAAQALQRAIGQDPELGTLFQRATTGRRVGANETTFNVFVNGERQTYVVPKTLEGIFKLDAPQIGPALGAVLDVASLAPVTRAGATGINALFIPVNAVRDAWNFMVRTGALSTPKGVLTAGLATRPGQELARAYVAAGREAIPEWLPLVNRLRASDAEWQRALGLGAGQTSEFHGLSPDQIRSRLLRSGQLYGGAIRTATDAKSLLGAVGDTLFGGVRTVGAAVETAPRRAAFRLAEQRGLDPQRAALEARDITVDFARGGTWAKVVNRVIPFFNVSVQSPERLVTYDFAKGRRLQASAGVVGGILIPSLAAESWNRTRYPGDYANVPQYLKDSGLVVMLPVDPAPNPDGSPGQRPFAYIPMPQQFNFLRIAQSEALARTLFAPGEGQTPAERGGQRSGWDDVLRAVVASTSPIGTTDTVPLPPTVRTINELSQNRDAFRGREIVPDSLSALPPEEQYTSSASAFGRAIAQAAVKLGLPGFSPLQADYAVTSILGGTGRQALDASNTFARAAGLPAAEQNFPGVVEAPIVGGLVGTIIRNRGGELDQQARKQVAGDLRTLSREAIAQLRADPEFQARTPAEQADEMRRLANALQTEMKAAQDLGVFSRPGQPGGTRKYIAAETPFDDARIDRAVVRYRRWLDDPVNVPYPGDDVANDAMFAVVDPFWRMEQEDIARRRESITESLPVPANRRQLPNR